MSTYDNSTFVDPICEVCPPGTLISDGTESLQLPSIAGGGTCKSVASMALGGCFDSMHCLFLQQMFLLRCCIYPSPDLPTPPLEDLSLIDANNHTIVPDDACDDVSYGAKNATSPFPGGNDDGACYMLSDGTFQDELCLENVFGELCLGAIDGMPCDSCHLGVSIGVCNDGGLPGVHLDCSGTSGMMDIDICNNGKVFMMKDSTSSTIDQPQKNTLNRVVILPILYVLYIIVRRGVKVFVVRKGYSMIRSATNQSPREEQGIASNVTNV